MKTSSDEDLEETSIPSGSPSDGESDEIGNMTFAKVSQATKRKSTLSVNGCAKKLKKINLNEDSAVDAAQFFSQFDPYVKVHPDLDRTWLPTAGDSAADQTFYVIERVDEDEAMQCSNCDVGEKVVAWCHQCEEDPYLCQGCVEAHKRVRLTKNHEIYLDQFLFIKERQTDCVQLFQNVLDAIVEKREFKKDENFYTFGKLKHSIGLFISEVSSENIEDKTQNELTENIIVDNLLAFLSGGSVEVKARTALVIHRLAKVKLVNPALFCDARGVRGFSILLSYPDVELLDPVLTSVQQLVVGLLEIDACFTLDKFAKGISQYLQIIKDSQLDFFESSRLGAKEKFGLCLQVYLDENHLLCPLFGCNPECLRKRAEDILTRMES